MPAIPGRVRTALAVALGLIAAVALYAWLFGRPGTILPIRDGPSAGGVASTAPPVPVSSAEHASMVQARWKELSLTPIAGADSAVPDAIGRLILATEELSDEMRRSLASRVSDELRARAGTAASYESYASADPTTRWLEPNDPQWATIDGWWSFAFGAAPSHDDAHSLLGPFVADLYEKRGGRFRSFGAGDDGAKLVCMRVRTAEEVVVRLDESLRKPAQNDRDYWLRATSSRPITFRVPKRGLSDVLKAAGIAQVAVVMLVVETEDGNRFNWQTVYVWDPQSGVWCVDMMARKGWSGTLWY